ncbi:MAG: hypothetical protein LWX02_05280 [Deltaproteobacteria bacterium]|nr:hypothetical protein [Deltaproteobacteria bacterium]
MFDVHSIDGYVLNIGLQSDRNPDAFRPLRGVFIKPPVLRVVGDFDIKKIRLCI